MWFNCIFSQFMDDILYSDQSIRLSMTSISLVVLTSFLLKNNDLWGQVLFLNWSIHLCRLDHWSANRSIVFCSNQEDLINDELWSNLHVKLFNKDSLILKHFMLFACKLNDCKHFILSLWIFNVLSSSMHN